MTLERSQITLVGLPLVLKVHGFLQRVYGDSLLRNSMYIMGTTVVTSLLGYAFWIIAARTYSPGDVGLGAALVSALMLVSTLSTLGLGSALIQLLPHSSSDRSWSLTLNAGLAASAAIGLLAGLTLDIGLPLISRQFSVVGHDWWYAVALCLGAPLWALTLMVDCTFQAERSSGLTLLRNAAFSTLKILLLFLLVVIRPGALGILLATVVPAALSLLFARAFLVPRLPHRHMWTCLGLPERARSMAFTVAGQHLINLGGLAPMYLLPILVTVRLSAAANAHFYAVWMLGGVFFMISSSVATALFAEGSHATAGSGRRARSSAKLIALLLPPVLLVYMVAGPAILRAFGVDYARTGWPLLVVLMLSTIPDGITNLYVSVLRVQRRLGAASRLNLGMAFSTLLLAWFLLPRAGLVGGGWAWLVGQCLGSLWVGVDLARRRSSDVASVGVRSASS